MSVNNSKLNLMLHAYSKILDSPNKFRCVQRNVCLEWRILVDFQQNRNPILSNIPKSPTHEIRVRIFCERIFSNEQASFGP